MYTPWTHPGIIISSETFRNAQATQCKTMSLKRPKESKTRPRADEGDMALQERGSPPPQGDGQGSVRKKVARYGATITKPTWYFYICRP